MTDLCYFSAEDRQYLMLNGSKDVLEHFQIGGALLFGITGRLSHTVPIFCVYCYFIICFCKVCISSSVIYFSPCWNSVPMLSHNTSIKSTFLLIVFDILKGMLFIVLKNN